MNIRLIGERLLVKPAASQRASGGHKEGTVAAVGSRDERPLPVHEGDSILFVDRTGATLTFEGETYVLVEWRDVIGRLDED